MAEHGGGSSSSSNSSSNSNNSNSGVGGGGHGTASSDRTMGASGSGGGGVHTFDRDAALHALHRLASDVDERFVEQHNLLRMAYEHLCLQIDQLRGRVLPFVAAAATTAAAAHNMTMTTTTPTGVSLADCLTPQKHNNSNNDGNAAVTNDDNKTLAMMTVGALLHSNNNNNDSSRAYAPRQQDTMLGQSSATSTLLGTPAAVGSEMYAYDERHGALASAGSTTPATTATATTTIGSAGRGVNATSAVGGGGPLSATHSHPFLSVLSDMTAAMTASADGDDAHKDDVVSSLAADLATAAAATVAAAGAATASSDAERDARLHRGTTAAAASATPPSKYGAGSSSGDAAAAAAQHVHLGRGAPPMHTPAGAAAAAAASVYDSGATTAAAAAAAARSASNEWHALSSTSPARHSGGGGGAAHDAFTASPQAVSKLSFDDLLSRFSNTNSTTMATTTTSSGGSLGSAADSASAVNLSFDKLYEQLTGAAGKSGSGEQSNRTSSDGNNGRLADLLHGDTRYAAATAALAGHGNNNSSSSCATPAAMRTTAAAAMPLLPLPLSASLPQQPQQQQAQQQPPPPPSLRHARAHDVIPIDWLSNLHDQHLTTHVKAVYEHGRPVVVPTPGGAPMDVAALGIDVRSSCQVLVEFKRKRVLQYDSVAFVAPGSYVMVGGDRGEDLGLVIYTWCEVSNKARGNNNNSSGSGSVVAGDAATGGGSSGSSGSDWGSAHDDATAGAMTAMMMTSTSAMGDASRRSAVVGIGLSGSMLTRSIGVGNGTVLRLANDADVRQLHTTQAELERRAIDVCAQRVLEHALPMVIVDAEYQFDKNKLTFFFEAQQRLDFRELVRDLYKTFRARIWMEVVDG